MTIAGASCAWAQNDYIGPLHDRLERLERDIRTLNTRLSKGGSPASPAAAGTRDVRSAAGVGEYAIARFQVRLSALEEELRLSTGKMEEMAYLLDQIRQRLDKLVGDVDFRLSTIEKELRVAPAKTLPEAPRASAAPSQPEVRTVTPLLLSPPVRQTSAPLPRANCGPLNQAPAPSRNRRCRPNKARPPN